jgi:predicted esterase
MKIYVVFIGGFQSDQTAMDLWLASARKQKEHADIVFDAYPFPNIKDSDRRSSVAGFEDQFDGVIKKIQDSGADKIFIVGHSSGCAIADEVNKRLGGDHKNVTLVDLDGFPPQPDQIQGSEVQAWYAVGPGGKGKSKNHKVGRIKYQATHATEDWSLHFSLVNKAATNKITWKTYKTEGYAGCMANLDFLDYKKSK